MSQDTRPFVFSFVSVNGSRKVLGTREVVRDELDAKLALAEAWVTKNPDARCATLYGPGMRRRVVTSDTRRWLEDMEIIWSPPVRDFPEGADLRIVEAEQAYGDPLYDEDGRPTAVGVSTLREVWIAARNVADMRAALRAKGLKVGGVKRTLAHRLAKAGIAPY